MNIVLRFLAENCFSREGYASFKKYGLRWSSAVSRCSCEPVEKVTIGRFFYFYLYSVAVEVVDPIVNVKVVIPGYIPLKE
jgi:hypothetical protein